MSTTSAASPWPANGLGSILDFASASHKRALGVLLIVCVMLFLPGFFQIPPVDRDEAYFAQATKQMIETGDYVDIRYQDDVRYRKPVGIYWLQAVVVKTAQALGDPGALTTIWLYRIPSLIGAIGAVMTTYWCALAFVSRRGAVLASIMLAASTLLGVEARLAKTDAVLLFTIVAAMAVLARAYLAPRDAGNDRLDWKLPAIFWTALAVGILIKGPVNLMIVGLAALTLSIFERSGRWLLALRPLAGIAWLFLIVLPWFVAIYARVGTAFFVGALGHDMLGKVAGAQEAHGAPPGCIFCFSLQLSIRARSSPGSPRRRYGAYAGSRPPNSCWRGWCRPGSYSNWWSPSCRTMCCRSIPRLRFSFQERLNRKCCRSGRGWCAARSGGSSRRS
jgi:4-amino-4-deoxy-L-arabinose transferase-like glycosyltransferase